MGVDVREDLRAAWEMVPEVCPVEPLLACFPAEELGSRCVQGAVHAPCSVRPDGGVALGSFAGQQVNVSLLYKSYNRRTEGWKALENSNPTSSFYFVIFLILIGGCFTDLRDREGGEKRGSLASRARLHREQTRSLGTCPDGEPTSTLWVHRTTLPVLSRNLETQRWRG